MGWVSNAVALYVASWLLSGVTYGDSWWSLLIAAAILDVMRRHGLTPAV